MSACSSPATPTAILQCSRRWLPPSTTCPRGASCSGLGAGWQVNEHEAYGIDLPAVSPRLARLEEACQVIRLLHTQERSDFDGHFYRLVDAPCEPKPVQSRLPLLIGGGGESVTMRIAARYADEWNCWGLPDLLAHKADGPRAPLPRDRPRSGLDQDDRARRSYR